MNWEMIAAVGEVVGAVGVILSLLYLASQIRSSTLESQRARYDQALEASTVWGQSVAVEGELADITFRGWVRGAAALTPEERFRFYASMLTLFRAYERMSQYAAEGGVHEWGKQAFDHTFQDLLAMPGIREYWADRKHWFAPTMQAEIDGMIVKAGAAVLDAYQESPDAEGGRTLPSS